MNLEKKKIFGEASAAISLTYDDSYDCQLDLVAPALEKYGFRGTFYTTINENFIKRMEDWAELSRKGHELGNHTLHHPCRKWSAAKWLGPERDLKLYTVERWEMEISLANKILDKVEGRTDRSYGNTCYHNTVGPDEAQIPLDPLMLKHFVAARGTKRRFGYSIDPLSIDLSNLGTLSGDELDFERWIASVDKAVELGHWVIFTFHEVGLEKGRLTVPEKEHTALLKHIASYGKDILIAPIRDIVYKILKYC